VSFVLFLNSSVFLSVLVEIDMKCDRFVFSRSCSTRIWM